MSAPKEFWELGTCLAKLKSDDLNQQQVAALHLKAHADREARIRTTQEFNLYMEEICKNIHDFCGSHNRNERMGGILLIRNLIDVVYADHDLHLQKLGRYLQKIIDYKTDVKDHIPELAAQTLGHLVQANPTSADIFDRQIRLAFEWLGSGTRNEYHIYMAMLIIRELAKAAPTLFQEHVHSFVKTVWIGITDAKHEIRETSKLALRQVFQLIGKKKAANSYFRLFNMARKEIQTKNSSNIHGAILVIGELLAQDEPSHIMGYYEDICRIFFKHKDARPPLLREAIIKLMPRLAHFNPERFSREYLDMCVRHIIQEHKMQSVPPEITYTALGGVAMAVRERIMSNIPAIISVLDEGLTRSRRQNAPSIATNALRCIAMLAEAIGPLLGAFASDLVDKMIKNGLTSDSGETLVRSLTALVNHVKDRRLLNDIQKRLLAAIFQILLPTSALPAAITGATAAASGNSVSSGGNFVLPSSETGIMGDVVKILRNAASSTSQDAKKADDPGVIRLALHTIGTFNFNNIRLLWFVYQCLIPYLDHPVATVREAAAVACSNLLLRPQDPFLNMDLRKNHYRAMVYRVLEQLLTVGIADPIPRIRETVILSLKPRFDVFLAQAKNLHALFVALNDEKFSIRAAAMSVIGRLALRNPAHVMPSLRKTLIHLLTELQCGADARSREQSCRLLGHLVESSNVLTKPYLKAILDVLLPGLNGRDPRLVGSIVETLGKLERVGGKELEPHLPKLIRFLLQQLAHRGQPIRRQVLLEALGRLVRTTGCVIRPYLDFPDLLPTLLRVLSNESKWEARIEVLRVLGILGALDPYQHKMNEAKLRHLISAAKRKGKSSAKGERALLQRTIGRHKDKTERAGRVSVNPTSVTDDRFLLPSMVGSLDEFYSTVATNALMRILGEPTLSSQHNSAMKAATYVFHSLGSKCSVFLPRIIPTLLSVIRRPSDEQSLALQKQVILRLHELVSIVGKDIRPYLEETLAVIYQRWTAARSYAGPLALEVLSLIENIALALRKEFKFYLPDLVPHLLRALHGSPPPMNGEATTVLLDKKLAYNVDRAGMAMVKQRVLRVLQSLGINLEDYLHLLIPTLVGLAERQEAPAAQQLSEVAVETLGKLCTKLDFRDYISCIVHPTARIIRGTRDATRRDKVMAMLLAVIKQMGVDFLLFVPLVNSALEMQNRAAVAQKWDSRERARLAACVDGYNWMVDIIMRGENPTAQDLDKALGAFNSRLHLSWERERKMLREMANSEKPKILERLTIDVPMLFKAWECHNKATTEDWLQWMNNFMVKLLEYSPSTSLRPCVTLAKRDQSLAQTLFNAAFLSVWTELNDTSKDNLVQNLETALRPSTPPEILQVLLNLAEFMEREDRALPILQDERKEQPTLGRLAERCHAFAKALHYKEIEFKTAPHNTIESLISLNNDLQQPDAAVGILKCAQDMRGMALQPSWYEKLQRWEDALEEYEVLQLHDQTNISHTLGRMRCLDSLGLWSRMAATCEHIWAKRVPRIHENDSKSQELVGTNLLDEDHIQQIATFGASATWELRDWAGMVKYVNRMPEGNLNTSIFKTVLAIHHSDFPQALKHIERARRSIFSEFRSLVAESYDRAYGHMVRLQVLSEFEEVVTFKQCKRPGERDHIRKMWTSRLRGTQRDIMVWRHILATRKLVLKPEEQIDELVDFSRLARKSQRLALSLQALSPLLSSRSSKPRSAAILRADPRTVKLPLSHPRVCLAYLSHLWDAGDDKKSLLNRLESLLGESKPPMTPRGDVSSHGWKDTPWTTNGEEKGSQTRMECYLRLGQWRRTLYGETTENLKHVLQAYKWATRIQRDSYNAWHAYSSVHFRLVSLFETEADKTRAEQKQIEASLRVSTHADIDSKPSSPNSKQDSADDLRRCRLGIDAHVLPAIEGFFRAISLAGPQRSTLQDVLRLLTLWFNHGGSEHPQVNQALSKGFNTTSIHTWLRVIPQIIARIYTPDPGVRKLVEQLLRKISKEHPQALIYPLTVASKSQDLKRKKAADGIMNYMRKHSEKLVDQAQLISTELIRVAILWHEMWHDALEEASKFWFGKRNVTGMLQVVEPLHQMMEKGPITMREVSFQQTYGKLLLDAKEWVDRYRESRNESDLNQAWDAYCKVWRSINKNRETLVTVELQHASPKLKAVRNLELAVPGTYERVVEAAAAGGLHDEKGGNDNIVRIAWFLPRLKVIESKQRPRRLSIIGSDGLEYSFLLKGHEDLRQDERVMQLFGLVNTLLATDDQTTQKNLSIHRYSVIPLAPTSGLIQWLQNCDTLHSLIKEYRDARSIMVQVETLLMKMFSNKVYEQLTVIQKIEVFRYALSKTSGLDLYHVLWLKSQDSETWLDRRTNYTRSLAVMSMVGYILGLGDRHPCNLMLDQFTGKIIHIDFGDCFEVAMQREKFPEKIPFRLTRMLINAMEVSGIEGNYRSTCEAVMRVLRTNKESVMAVLEAFVYDPLINWRLLQTKVSRLHQNPEQQDEIDDDKLSEESEALLGDEAEDNTKEAGEEVLNSKALNVIGRIASKLDGNDFGDGEPLNVPQQVEKLIRQATSHANLCQCYIGWCPFW